jgi:hypothetical protein
MAWSCTLCHGRNSVERKCRSLKLRLKFPRFDVDVGRYMKMSAPHQGEFAGYFIMGYDDLLVEFTATFHTHIYGMLAIPKQSYD